MHRYIISNSDTVEDVMNVLHYLKFVYQDEDKYRYSATFETMEGLMMQK